MKLVVIGSSGQLGADLLEVLSRQGSATVVGLDHDAIELADKGSIVRALAATEPDWVINTAALHHLGKCEERPARAFAVNAIGAWHLARACADLDAGLVHVSTDYVFGHGHHEPLGEDAPPAPLNVYGASKLAGEHLIAAGLARHLIVRTSALYGAHPCRAKGGESFVELMLRLARELGVVRVVDDERVSPTATLDLAWQIAALLDGEVRGVVHATSRGECSWYDFAREIFRLRDLEVTVERASAADFGGGVRRPPYSVLANRVLERAGLDRMPPWQEALARYLGRRR